MNVCGFRSSYVFHELTLRRARKYARKSLITSAMTALVTTMATVAMTFSKLLS